MQFQRIVMRSPYNSYRLGLDAHLTLSPISSHAGCQEVASPRETQEPVRTCCLSGRRPLCHDQGCATKLRKLWPLQEPQEVPGGYPAGRRPLLWFSLALLAPGEVPAVGLDCKVKPVQDIWPQACDACTGPSVQEEDEFEEDFEDDFEEDEEKQTP